MRFSTFLFVALVLFGTTQAQPPSVFSGESKSQDSRRGNLQTLNGHFPFVVPSTAGEWHQRAEQLKRRVLVSTGLWPMPEKTPLNPVIFDKSERNGFTIEKVYFQSLPGHYVTGLLFRPSTPSEAPMPGVLSPHGHGGRMQTHSEAEIAKQIAQGAEHFEKSGRTPKLARCVQLARMGCVTFIFDMLGYADSIQIPRQIAHRHKDARPEEKNGSEKEWVLYSPQADLRLQSIMGIQTWNSIRALDFLESLPDVDPDRLAVTGGSGGGTQSILLGAIDDRIKVSFPNGMVSTSMQGGCYCENCNLLRVGTGNVELAALFTPRPQAMTAADDWTRDMMSDGYPQLKLLYAMIGNEADVYCRPMLHFKHNYNYVTRATMYQWMNRHLKLGLDDPVIEQDFEPLTEDETTIWGGEHTAPKEVGTEHERAVCRWLDQQAQEKLSETRPLSKEKSKEFRSIVGRAWQVIFDLGIPHQVTYQQISDTIDNGIQLSTGLVSDTNRKTELPLLTLKKENADGEGCIIWTAKGGKADLFDSNGKPGKELQTLLQSGRTVLVPDLHGQGELLFPGEEEDEQRLIDDPRSFSAFTFGYNRTLAAERCGDLLTILAHAKQMKLGDIRLLATPGTAAWAAPAAAISGQLIDRAVIDTGGFRFAKVDNFRDANFVPGAVKYGDLPTLLALRAPFPLMILGEKTIPKIVQQAYGTEEAETLVQAGWPNTKTKAVDWITSP